MPRTIFENIVIQHFENVMTLDYCQYTPIRFFEILFFEKGKGTLIINNKKVIYEENQVFILIPNDEYNIEIDVSTTVSAVKFLNNFFDSFQSVDNQLAKKEWFNKIETILHNTNRASHIQLQSNKEESSIYALFKVLCNEYTNRQIESEMIMQSTLYNILLIISRNVNQVVSKKSKSKIQDMVNYIHYHIHDSEKLSKKALSEKFYISENYLSEYFRNKMAIGLKKYIINYKLKLVETRLKYTDLTVSEIAQELGFTDSSHLDKIYSKYKGMTTGVYKSTLLKK